MSAYWIAHVNIKDSERYQDYMALAPAAFHRFNARFLARGGVSHTLEGDTFEKHVLIEFDDLASAMACYHSAEYQLARAKRADIAEASIVIVEGI